MYSLCFIILWLIIVSVAAILTLDERKMIATIQNRHGPARVGYGGLLQPISDAFKMILKEFITPHQVKNRVFRHSAMLSFIFASFFWIAIPYHNDFTVSNIEFGLMFLILISLLHIYSVLAAGWSSNSKYSFLGAIRTVCQLISYDIVVIFVFINLIIHFRTMDLYIIPLNQYHNGYLIKFTISVAITFIISFLSESSRHPFDLPEAEAELVSGYNVEYSSIKFAMFFLAEYSSVLYVSILFMFLFLSPYSTYGADFTTECVKCLLSVVITIAIRALLPRYRYDQLMRSCWKSHIPAVCSSFFVEFIVYFLL